MTVEYVLLMVMIFSIGLKFFSSAPMDAFRQSGPRLGAKVEDQLTTGNGFNGRNKAPLRWDGGK